jgi:UDP-N-acetylmuramoyl-tripeptide--D-alanyl-D-alanine ligase
MRRRPLTALPRLVRSPLGRRIVYEALLFAAWPALRCLAAFHRRVIVRRTRVVVVIGSFGKTTTARALVAALGTRPLPRWSNSYSRLARAVLGIRPGDRWAVLEVGIRTRGQMAVYARLVRPDVVVVTSIGSEHHRAVGPLEAIREEKAAMVRALSPGGLVIVNGDDPHARWIAGQTAARVVTCGFGADNDVQAVAAAITWPAGTRVSIRIGDRVEDGGVRLLGRHQVRAILAAVAVAHEAGVSPATALGVLGALVPTPGRLEPVALRGGATLLRDDFKSAEETIEAALDVLAEIPARRRIVVLGDVEEPLGSQARIYRRLGGRLAHVADRVVVVGGGFRAYAAGWRATAFPRDGLAGAGRAPSGAIRALDGTLEAGDVVLVKGRSTQRLERVALALSGRDVRCDIAECRAPAVIRCADCAMLERGWGERPSAT